MTSSLRIPNNSEVNNMSSNKLKNLLGKKTEQQIDFMGEKMTIYKLSVAQVMTIQKVAAAGEESDDAGLMVLVNIIREGMEGGSELSDEDFQNFSIDDLTKAANAIMKFSGMDPEAGKKGQGK